MEENNEEKLSTLFNNRFVESLNRAIENKNQKISELEERSKVINRKSVLIDYSSQLLTGISYTDLINELIECVDNPNKESEVLWFTSRIKQFGPIIT